MSDPVKIALIAAAALIVSVSLWIYFSPYHSCLRSGGNERLCAWVSGGGRN
ncbi:MAG: hypothetical protein ACRECF_03645 [Methyloceanibacter sp.]